MQIVQLRDSRYAVKSIGGNTLNRILAEFASKIEAEEWMMRHTALARAGSGLLLPGGGEAVA